MIIYFSFLFKEQLHVLICLYFHIYVFFYPFEFIYFSLMHISLYVCIFYLSIFLFCIPMLIFTCI